MWGGRLQKGVKYTKSTIENTSYVVGVWVVSWNERILSLYMYWNIAIPASRAGSVLHIPYLFQLQRLQKI